MNRINRRRFVSLALASLTAACAYSNPPVTTQELTGVLTLKGNAPKTYAVLRTDDHQLWQLRGIEQSDAANLQQQRIVVEGRPALHQGASLLPVFEVERYRLISPASGK
ncbi:hypothetical protein IAI53_16020 [Thauera sp. CAU 1555]|uniref:Lipoprotein n=1 Tax=Thauera sedimentorum TaxID=2767595 RepID=A0ABR9BG33_9RHOO|nr:hypothetical protein [Thauera sedimentorum]MBC9073478.1 hypothetical protein [Thauera sedimentorum]MBD8504397.1 hypothetical protein [Thauera sedimentorum]